jgi:hypothetical protein
VKHTKADIKEGIKVDIKPIEEDIKEDTSMVDVRKGTLSRQVVGMVGVADVNNQDGMFAYHIKY